MTFHRMRPPRRMVAALAALLGVAGLVGVSPDARAAAGFELQRVAGANRYETAARLATAAFQSGSTTAVLASGENFPDALAGSFLAGRFGAGAPILLTTRDDLPTVTADALETLGVTTVYVLGGTGAVGEGVEEDLGDYEVVRIAGNDRYETAAQIATFEADGIDAAASTVIVASGLGFADALAAGPLAFKGSLPIVLTPAGALDDAAAAAIEDVEATSAWIVGGTAVVGTAVENELKSMGLSTLRIAGATRYETAVAVAGRARSSVAFSAAGVGLASGENFPDALAAGPLLGINGWPLLLTAAASLSGPTEDYLVDNNETLTQGRVFGGPAAVSEAAVTQAESAGATGQTIGAVRVVRIEKANDVYYFVREGTDEIHKVEYEAGDQFTVDGNTASIGGFEASLSVGDIIAIDNDPTAPDGTEDEGTGDETEEETQEEETDPTVAIDASEHDLSNVSGSSFTSGMVGNVDLENNQLDIIEPVSGVALRSNVTYSGTFRVDAGNADLATFEEDVNEGDTIEIAGGFNLTNRDTGGLASDVTHADVPPSATFTIDKALGDIPADDADAAYQANCSPSSSGQNFAVDGANSTCDAFIGDLTDGDQVTYRRKDGVESFILINDVPSDVVGAGIDNLITDGDGRGDDPNNTNPLVEADDSDGGSFEIVDDYGDIVTIDYTNGGLFVVDDEVSNEATFETEYSAGDRIVYRPADADSGAEQYVELTNDDLAGVVTEPNTSDESPAANDNHSPGESSTASAAPNPENSYTVERFDGDTITGQQEDDELEVVVYHEPDEPSANTYFVNGVSASLACFEDALGVSGTETIVRDGGDTPYADGNDAGSIHDAVWEHELRISGTKPASCT